MKVKTIPEDFIVEEELDIPLAGGGRYAVYRAQKRAITTLQLQARLAAALKRPRSTVRFPALKDRRAVAIQFGTLRGPGPPAVGDEHFAAERVG
jgi:tRNA pseudouridine13 synthase